MKVSAIATVLIASSVLVAGAAIERRNHVAIVAPSPSTSVVPRPYVAPERIATVVTLPEITVRPSAEDIALARAEPTADARPQAALPGPVKVNASSSSGRLNFDMPYYSFGKALPHVSRD